MVTYVGNALYAHAKEGCYRCVRGDGLVDFDVQIEGEGALAICKSCIAEAAEAAGMTFNGAHVRELRAEVQELETELVRARAAELTFNAALDAAREAFFRPDDPVSDAATHPAVERCAATTKAGNPCKGVPTDGDLCAAHAQKVARDERREAS